MIDTLYSSPQHLLSLTDVHGAPLADFDLFAEQELLLVCWHGHLTASSVVAGVQTSLQRGLTARRILSDTSHTSGNWDEALPWVQYDWLPQAVAGGLRALAYVLSPDPAAQPAIQEFLQITYQEVALKLFRCPIAARQWLLRH